MRVKAMLTGCCAAVIATAGIVTMSVAAPLSSQTQTGTRADQLAADFETACTELETTHRATATWGRTCVKTSGLSPFGPTNFRFDLTALTEDRLNDSGEVYVAVYISGVDTLETAVAGDLPQRAMAFAVDTGYTVPRCQRVAIDLRQAGKTPVRALNLYAPC